MTLSEDNTAGTELQEFYKGTSIFITGATGFLGKALLEKLLRSLPDLNRIFLLIREKKGKTVHQRMEDLFDDPVFDLLKKDQSKFLHKVVPVAGDCLLHGLGLSEVDRCCLIEQVNIIFHVAATVRFDEKLRIATQINIISTRDILNLAKQMANLKAIVHVSTAYSHCNLSTIKEEFYEPPLEYMSLLTMLNTLTDDVIDDATPRLLKDHPNTYNFTKAIAEDVVRKEGFDLPIGVFRPALIVSSKSEPFPGWIDNFYGPTGLLVSVGSGILRVLYINPDIKFNLVPVDMTANAMIATAWDVAKRNKDPTEDIPVYNYVSSAQNPLTVKSFMNLAEFHQEGVPSTKILWYPTYVLTQNRFFYVMLCFFLHTLPAAFVDFILFLIGKKPRLMRLYKKVHNISDILLYFTNQNWTHSDDNIQQLWKNLNPDDQNLFNFDITQIDWGKFIYHYLCGCRVHLLKDEMHTVPEAKIKHKRFFWLHQIVKFAIAILMLRLIWFFLTTVMFSLRRFNVISAVS